MNVKKRARIEMVEEVLADSGKARVIQKLACKIVKAGGHLISSDRILALIDEITGPDAFECTCESELHFVETINQGMLNMLLLAIAHERM
jgi:hypothetical protein